MGKTSIEWVKSADGAEGYSWNALRAERKQGGRPGITANHCEHVNLACVNCYAEALNARLGGLPFKPGHRKDYRFFVDEEKLTAPLRMRKPTRVFVESMSDAFGDWWPDSFIDQLYAVMALTPHHTYINLSKRPERRRRYRADPDMPKRVSEVAAGICKSFPAACSAWDALKSDLPNVIEGTSVSCQPEADEFVPILLRTKCAQTAVSAEPLLGPIDFVGGGRQWLRTVGQDGAATRAGLGGIFVGGESGAKARPMRERWVRSIRDQFENAGVPFHFKQWGAWLPGTQYTNAHRDLDPDLEQSRFRCMDWDGDTPRETDGMWCDDLSDDACYRLGKKRAGRLLDGREWNGFPEIAR